MCDVSRAVHLSHASRCPRRSPSAMGAIRALCPGCPRAKAVDDPRTGPTRGSLTLTHLLGGTRRALLPGGVRSRGDRAPTAARSRADGSTRRGEHLAHHRPCSLGHGRGGGPAHLRRSGFEVAIAEPHQHYQFAGRADRLGWDLDRRALIHIENRTRFPDMQGRGRELERQARLSGADHR